MQRGGDQRRALELAHDLLAMADRFPLPLFVMIGNTTVGSPVTEDLFHGRAEHLASGQVVQFESLNHLAEFVAQVLDRSA